MMLVFGMETAVNRHMLPSEIAATNLVSSSHLQRDQRSREVYRRMGGRLQEEHERKASVVAFLSLVLTDTTFASASR